MAQSIKIYFTLGSESKVFEHLVTCLWSESGIRFEKYLIDNFPSTIHTFKISTSQYLEFWLGVEIGHF